MPVNIFDIPSEEKTSQKTLSLWVEFGICVCILAVYVCVFLVYFPEYLSKNNYAFWSELLLVPLLLSGAVFFFRVIIWNNENIETVYWNKTRWIIIRSCFKKEGPILRSLSYRSDCLI